jgi:hypothetical protein
MHRACPLNLLGLKASGPEPALSSASHVDGHIRSMLTPRIRETMMRELHSRRVSVDQLARYLLVMDKYDAREVATLPCPRCHADGIAAPMVVTLNNAEIISMVCDRCFASYDFGA